MRTVKVGEAAAMLNVSATTLRGWEQRFGYPRPRRSPGQHRRYVYAEIAALRDGLQSGLGVSSAVSHAREALRGDTFDLVGALYAFSGHGAGAAMEASLALRPIERSVQEVLLPALEEVLDRKGAGSAAWSFALGWSNDWLRRAQHLVRSARHGALLIGDASDPATDITSAYVRALELLSTLAGFEVLSLPVHAREGLTQAVAALAPGSAVVAGDHAGDDAVAGWAYAVRRGRPGCAIASYRREHHGSRALPPSPALAARELSSFC
jgi:DNA-binding transcriptional MerR regulator